MSWLKTDQSNSQLSVQGWARRRTLLEAISSSRKCKGLHVHFTFLRSSFPLPSFCYMCFSSLKPFYIFSEGDRLLQWSPPRRPGAWGGELGGEVLQVKTHLMKHLGLQNFYLVVKTNHGSVSTGLIDTALHFIERQNRQETNQQSGLALAGTGSICRKSCRLSTTIQPPWHIRCWSPWWPWWWQWWWLSLAGATQLWTKLRALGGWTPSVWPPALC